MERRLMLDATLPSSVWLGANGTDNITGDPGGYTLTLTGNVTFNADISTSGSDWQNCKIVLATGTQAVFNTRQTIGGLELDGTATASVSSGGGGANGNVMVIGSSSGLSIASGATLDLTDNDIILQNAGSAGVTELQSLLASGYHAGDWKGAGLLSSSAANTVGTSMQMGIGFALNASPALSTPFTTFDGISVGSSDVITKYTLAGDQDLNGVVNNTDYLKFKKTDNTTGTTWTTGDYNYDGATDNTHDYALLEGNYGETITGPAFNRPIQPAAQTIAGLSSGVYSGPVGSFTDSNNPTAASSTASYYVATIDWGDGNFVSATVSANGNGGFTVTATSPFALSDPNALIVMQVQYASGSPYAGQEGSLSTPITLVPQAINNLTATAAGTSEIDLAWTLSVTDSTGIQIQRSTDRTNFTPIATLATTATTYADTGLNEGLEYWYSVTAQPLTGAAATSAVNTWTQPNAPSSLSATVMDAHDVQLSWTNNSAAAPPFNIERSTDGVNFTGVTTTDAGVTSSIDANVSDDTAYTYRVVAGGGDGANSPPSNSASITTPQSVLTALTATSVSDAQINLSWTDNSGGTATPQVWRSSDGTTWTLVASLTPGNVTYSDGGVSPDTEYGYYVSAAGAPSATASSNQAGAVTLPAAPTGVTATAESNGDVSISWTAPTGDADAYQILSSTDGVNFTELDETDSTTATYDDAAAPDGVTDYYEVCALNIGAASAPSNIVSATPVAPIRMADPAPAVGGSYMAPHGAAMTINVADLLAQFDDPNNDPVLTVTGVTQPAHGTLIDNGDGTFTYQSASGYTGADSFSYAATDQYSVVSPTATVGINVTDTPPDADSQLVTYLTQAQDSNGNNLGYAAPYSGSMGGSDADGDPLTWSVVTPPQASEGTFQLDAQTGAFTFTPTQNASMSTATVVMKANDGALDSNLATVIFPGYTISGGTMTSIGLPTVGGNFEWGVAENGTLQVGAPGMLSGARDPYSSNAPYVSGIVAGPQHGTLSSVNMTDGSFIYQPTPGFLGEDFFTYEVMGQNGSGGYATIAINVTPTTASLSFDGLAPGDPSAQIPSPQSVPAGSPAASTYAVLNLNTYSPGVDGTTLTLSVNSDVAADLDVYDGIPGNYGTNLLFGYGPNTDSYTWTIGSGTTVFPTKVYVAGVAPTAYNQVTLTLAVTPGVQKIYSPPPASAPATQPVNAAQPAQVPGGSGYLAAFDGTGGTAAKNDDIYQFFHDHYTPTTKKYYPGVANHEQHNTVGQIFGTAFGHFDATGISHKAFHDLTTFYNDAVANRSVPFDTIGWSRGAFEAVDVTWMIHNHGIDDWNTKDTKSGKVQFKKIPVTIRYVGLISPVGQMPPPLGPLLQDTYWHKSLPPGVKDLVQALDKHPDSITYPETTMSPAPGTPMAVTRFNYFHRDIGYKNDVLHYLVSQAIQDGLPVV